MSGASEKIGLGPTAVMLLGLTALVAWAYQPVLDLALLGWDSWPMILTSRVQVPADLWGNFTEQLMDGRYPHGAFYRPMANLAFAADYALSGTDPAGYHRTDLLILAVNTCLVALVACRLFNASAGRLRRLLAGCLAGAVFCLHPVQLELITAAPRRADTLCLMFLLLTLLCVPRPGTSGRSRWWLLVLLAAMAAGSKETGAIVFVVVFAWSLFQADPEQELGRRIPRAILCALPAFLGVALYMLARTLVLGGLGGHSGPPVETVPRLTLFQELLVGVFYPRPLLGPAGAWLPWLLALLLLVGAAISSRSSGQSDLARATKTCACWILCILGMTAFADRFHAWYALLVLAPYSVLLGTQIAQILRPTHGSRLKPIWLGAVIPIGLLISHLSTAWPWNPTPRLEAASRLCQLDLMNLKQMIDTAQDGGVLRLNPWHPMIEPDPEGAGVNSLFLTSDYSLSAWCELNWPERRIEVSVWSGAPSAPEPGVLKVDLIPGPTPSWVKD